ncbi:adenylate kinase [Kitasatospora gansuensis]|uniref:Adenylate kinase n=1 Tax=Kitasatospora gansuensis TaxID=258050 RepID=A0A7W7SJ07_9ACTN|nr:nucleoside monophosphate kinase [Kitasatospora gansuensis]MBB4951369.1 adenylate kinase [Kitasatospora gansuensis]
MRVVLFQSPVFTRESPAASLAEALAVPEIHLGDLMRAHLSQGTELGIRAAEIINSGNLFPDEMITAVIRDHLHRSARADFLLVGHPHSAAQALALDELLRELGTPLDSVLYLKLPERDVERHVHLLASRQGAANEIGVRLRFESHEAMMVPIAQHYAGQGLLITVDAVGTPDEISRRALTALRERAPRP